MSHSLRLRLLVYLSLNFAAMWVTLKHIFGDAKPFDWLMLSIEVLVLALIAYEVVTSVKHRRRNARRIASIFKLVRQGQDIENSFPPYQSDEAIVTAWINKVVAWDTETRNTLAQFSPQAAASYAYDSSKPGVHYRGVNPNAHHRFIFLKSRLDNLRSIMEKPDGYF
jgi:hypothetical protein